MSRAKITNRNELRKSVSLTMNDEELARVKALAEKAGLSVSAYCRYKALKEDN